MMLSIHGLPLYVKYHDLKVLVKEECNISDFFFDNLVGESETTKTVRIALAKQEDGVHLYNCLDGFQMAGHVLRVVPVGNPQPVNMQNSFEQGNGYPQRSDYPPSGPNSNRPEMSRPIGRPEQMQNRPVMARPDLIKYNIIGSSHHIIGTSHVMEHVDEMQGRPEVVRGHRGPIGRHDVMQVQPNPVRGPLGPLGGPNPMHSSPGPSGCPDSMQSRPGMGKPGPNQSHPLSLQSHADQWDRSSNQWGNQPGPGQSSQQNNYYQPSAQANKSSFGLQSRPSHPNPFTSGMPSQDRGHTFTTNDMSEAQVRGESRANVLRSVEIVDELLSRPIVVPGPSAPRASAAAVTISKENFQGPQLNLDRDLKFRPSPWAHNEKQPFQKPTTAFDKPGYDRKYPDPVVEKRSRDGPTQYDKGPRFSPRRDVHMPQGGRDSPGRRLSPGRRSSPVSMDRRRAESPRMRYGSPSRDKSAGKYGHPAKDVRPAYDTPLQAPNQETYSRGYLPNQHENTTNAAPGCSHWEDRAAFAKKEEERRDLDPKARSPRESRSPLRRPLERSPPRDRYVKHSMSPRSPRRSWALEKRRSPDEAPPPPMWPAQSRDDNYKRSFSGDDKNRSPVWERPPYHKPDRERELGTDKRFPEIRVRSDLGRPVVSQAPRFVDRDGRADARVSQREPAFDPKATKFEPQFEPRRDNYEPRQVREPKFEPRDIREPKFEPRGPTFEPRFPKFEPRDPNFEPRRDLNFEPRRDPKFEERDPFEPRRDPEFEPRDPNFEPRRGPKFEPRAPNFEPRRDSKYEPRDPEFEPRRDTKFEPREPKYEPRHDSKFEPRGLKFEPRDARDPHLDTRGPEFGPRDQRTPRLEERRGFDRTVLETIAKRYDKLEREQDRDSHGNRHADSRRDELMRRESDKKPAKSSDFNKEFDDVYKRSLEFKQKVEELRRSGERRKEAFDNRRPDDRRPADGKYGRDDNRQIEDQQKTRPETKNESQSGDWAARMHWTAEMKAKRDKAIEEICGKMIHKYGAHLNQEQSRRVLDELRKSIRNIFINMFEDRDVSFIEMVVKFNARHDAKTEMKLFEEVINDLPTSYRKRHSGQDIHEDPPVPAKTARLSADNNFSSGEESHVPDWSVKMDPQQVSLLMQQFDILPQMMVHPAMPMVSSLALQAPSALIPHMAPQMPMHAPIVPQVPVQSPMVPQVPMHPNMVPELSYTFEESNQFKKQSSLLSEETDSNFFNLYLCKDDFEPYSSNQAEYLKKFLVSQIIAASESSSGWTPDFTLKGLQSLYRYELVARDKPTRDWIMNLDFSGFSFFNVLVYTKEELWYERAAIWLPGHSKARNIEPLEKLRLQNRHLDSAVNIGKWKLIKKIVTGKGTRLYVDMPPSSARALEKHKMMLSYELQKVNVFLKAVAVDKDAFDMGLKEISVQDDNVILNAIQTSPMPSIGSDDSVVKFALKGNKPLNVLQARKIKEMVIYRIFKYHQEKGSRSTDFVKFGFCLPGYFAVLPENSESRRWLQHLNLGKLYKHAIVVLGAEEASAKLIKMSVIVTRDSDGLNGPLILERLKLSNQGVKGLHFNKWKVIRVFAARDHKVSLDVNMDVDSIETISKMNYKLDYVDRTKKLHAAVVRYERSYAKLEELVKKYKAEQSDSYDVANMELESEGEEAEEADPH